MKIEGWDLDRRASNSSGRAFGLRKIDTLVLSLLTFWPPGPLDLLKVTLCGTENKEQRQFVRRRIEYKDEEIQQPTFLH